MSDPRDTDKKQARMSPTLPTRPAVDMVPARGRWVPGIGVLVGLGGALGAVTRAAIGGYLPGGAGAVFPWSTFTVNVLGSLGIGWIIRRLDRSASPGAEGHAFLAIGVCGGFTTFSTFDYEVLVLLQQGRLGIAAAYSLGSVAACVGGVVLGSLLAGAPPTRRH